MMKYLLVLCVLISSFVFGGTKNKPLEIIKLADNVYQHKSYKEVGQWGMVGASGLVVVDGKHAHLIDTPWTLEETKELLAWIKSQDLIAKSGVVTHFHEDASGGISLLNDLQINTYATHLTNKMLKSKGREQSSHEISSFSFKLANGSIEVYYPGAGHTRDNIVVWLDEEKILFGGCFVKSLSSKGLGNTADASIKEWPQSITNVINRFPQTAVVVPGHGRVGDKSLLEHTRMLALSAKAL